MLLLILFGYSNKSVPNYQLSYMAKEKSSILYEYHNERISDYLSFLSPKQSNIQEKICHLPAFKFEGHSNNETYKDCKQKNEWGYLKDNRWHLNSSVVGSWKFVVCNYRVVIRNKDDFHIGYSKFKILNDNTIILDDVIHVVCTAFEYFKRITFDNLYVQIVDRKIPPPKRSQLNVDENDQECNPFNILLLSYDSISRVSWFKRLPKTTAYLLEAMQFQILYGQSIMGDGTPACMIPLLTGKTEEELPSALKNVRIITKTKTLKNLKEFKKSFSKKDPNGSFVDEVYPFIWQDLHKKGYMSFHLEDWPQVTTFTYRMRGMSNRHAHHYMRTYQMELWRRVSGRYFANKDDFCIGAQKRHLRALKLIDEFTTMYRSRPHISIMHYIENSHDSNARISHMDTDTFNFLKTNFEAGHFENTIIFLYSDHGARFNVERKSPQGYLEERSPFFSVYLPPKFRQKYPEKVANLKKNSQQITTAFDIHATLREVKI
jgi:hypothetical protein